MINKNLFSVLAALTASISAFAQQIPAPTQSQTGVLGQRYADVSFGAQDFHGFSDNAYGLGVGASLPFNESLDVGFGYGYNWLDSNAELRSQTLSTSATAYTHYKGVKPFVGAALGYQWTKTKFSTFSVKNHDWVWGLGVGVEVPVGVVTLTPSIGYADTFDGGGNGYYTTGIEANHWFTKTVAGYADVSFSDVRGSGGESWLYSIGVRVKF